MGSDNEAVKNVSFRIHYKEKIALVGSNGSGKTTLIKLLMRLYDPVYGKIKIDNIDIRNFNVHKYRKMFAVCFQDYKIYAMTIAENILMRKPNSDNDILKVEAVLKQVGLYAKIKKFPNYLDTMLTKEFDNTGIFLSVGETQKLVIACALASDAPILVLDDHLVRLILSPNMKSTE